MADNIPRIEADDREHVNDSRLFPFLQRWCHLASMNGRHCALIHIAAFKRISITFNNFSEEGKKSATVAMFTLRAGVGVETF